jgi:hypothetical protein
MLCCHLLLSVTFVRLTQCHLWQSKGRLLLFRSYGSWSVEEWQNKGWLLLFRSCGSWSVVEWQNKGRLLIYRSCGSWSVVEWYFPPVSVLASISRFLKTFKTLKTSFFLFFFFFTSFFVVIFHFYIQYRHYNSFTQQDITRSGYIYIYIYLCIELIPISQVITYEMIMIRAPDSFLF